MRKSHKQPGRVAKLGNGGQKSHERAGKERGESSGTVWHINHKRHRPNAPHLVFRFSMYILWGKSQKLLQYRSYSMPVFSTRFGAGAKTPSVQPPPWLATLLVPFLRELGHWFLHHRRTLPRPSAHVSFIPNEKSNAPLNNNHLFPKFFSHMLLLSEFSKFLQLFRERQRISGDSEKYLKASIFCCRCESSQETK